jgi:hypothetical protein
MLSTHEADLVDVPSLSLAARKADIFPNLSAGPPLISIGQLCDSGCTAICTAKNFSIKLGGQIILTGIHSPVTELWSVDLPTSPVTRTPGLPTPPPSMQQANTTSQSASPAQLVAFAHAALFSPVLGAMKSPDCSQVGKIKRLKAKCER